METYAKRNEFEQLLLSDDYRPLLQLLRRHDLNKRRFNSGKNLVKQLQSSWPGRLLRRWARNRLHAYCARMDLFHIVLKSRAENLIAVRCSHPHWSPAVDDLLGAVRSLSFYDSEVKRRVLFQISSLLDQLVKRRVSRLFENLFIQWDLDGYLSRFSVDWGIDAERFLNSYDGVVVYADISRADLASLAHEFIVLIGRDTAPRGAGDPCPICIEGLDAAGAPTMFCHCRHGDVCCGQEYHRACIQAWIAECKDRNQLPTCPSCKGVWITRRPKPGFF